MEIKDIVVEVELLEEVRGGNGPKTSYSPMSGNTLTQVAVGPTANQASLIGVGGGVAIQSPVSIALSNVAAGDIVQNGAIMDADSYSWVFTSTDSIFDLF